MSDLYQRWISWLSVKVLGNVSIIVFSCHHSTQVIVKVVHVKSSTLNCSYLQNKVMNYSFFESLGWERNKLLTFSKSQIWIMISLWQSLNSHFNDHNFVILHTYIFSINATQASNIFLFEKTKEEQIVEGPEGLFSLARSFPELKRSSYCWIINPTSLSDYSYK